MKQKILYLLMLLFFTFEAYAQNKEIDSLKNIAEKSTGDKKARALLNIARFHLINRDTLAFAYCDRGFEAAETPLMKARALYFKSFAYRDVENPAMQIDLLKKSLIEFRQSNDTLAAGALQELSTAYRLRAMYPEALKTAFEEFELRKKLAGEQELVLALQSIGYTYDRMGEFKTAIEWYEKATVAAQELEDDFLIGRTFGLIGIAYDELQQYDKALENNFKAIEYFQKVEDPINVKIWYSNIGNTYTKLGDYQNAEKYILKSLAISEKTNAELVTRVNLGKIYLETNRFDQAQKVLDSALILIQKVDEKKVLSEVYYRLHELRKKQNNYKEALDYYQKYKENEDVLFNQAKAKQINEMSIAYKTNEKENQILEQRAVIAENDLKIGQKNFQIILTLFLLLTSVLLGYLFFYRQKQKAGRLERENQLKDALSKIETQKELHRQRTKISRDLHDNIGSQLTFITSSLENIKYYFKENSAEINKKIDAVSHYTKQTIVELRDMIWAMNKEEMSLEDLKNRIGNLVGTASEAKEKIRFDFQVATTLNMQQKLTSFEGINIFRVIQEALNNAIKHSDATRIEVAIEKQNGFLLFSVSDNGKGFAITSNFNGDGLHNMKKRIEEIAGKFSIKTSPEDGTQVLIKYRKK
ncbi:MAG: sensor histidine kinase [Flavobacteriaceae bacterium]